MYRAVLLCKSKKLESIADLKGRRAAWVDQLSAAGFLLPAAHLRANGVDPDADLASQKFYGSYATAIRAVLSKDADFTSVYARGEDRGAAMRILVDLIGERARHLRLLGFTPEAPDRRSGGHAAPHRGRHDGRGVRSCARTSRSRGTATC